MTWENILKGYLGPASSIGPFTTEVDVFVYPVREYEIESYTLTATIEWKAGFEVKPQAISAVSVYPTKIHLKGRISFEDTQTGKTIQSEIDDPDFKLHIFDDNVDWNEANVSSRARIYPREIILEEVYPDGRDNIVIDEGEIKWQ